MEWAKEKEPEVQPQPRPTTSEQNEASGLKDEPEMEVLAKQKVINQVKKTNEDQARLLVCLQEQVRVHVVWPEGVVDVVGVNSYWYVLLKIINLFESLVDKEKERKNAENEAAKAKKEKDEAIDKCNIQSNISVTLQEQVIYCPI